MGAIDRNFGNAQGLWTANPDGTSHTVYYGNNTPAGGVVLFPRAIPGTELVLCVLSSCHDRPWGALAILDRQRGLDGRAPILRTWPASAIKLVSDPGAPNGGFDSFTAVRPKYEDPYPLSDKYFLCSRMIGKGEQMGIYLVDVFATRSSSTPRAPAALAPGRSPRARARRSSPPTVITKARTATCTCRTSIRART